MRKKKFYCSCLICVVIRISHTLLCRFGNIISDGWNSIDSILISFFWNIPPPGFRCFSKTLIFPHLELGCLSLKTLSSIPLIRLNPYSKDVIWWKLFLPEIGWFAKFVILSIYKIQLTSFYKFCLREAFTTCLWSHYLLHFPMNWILLDFSESIVSRIYWPVIRSLLLLTWIIVQMGFQVHLSDLLRLRHILSRIYCLFNIVFVLLGLQTKTELLFASFSRQLVFTVNCTAKWLPLKTAIFRLENVIHIISYTNFLSSFKNHISPITFFGWNTISMMLVR